VLSEIGGAPDSGKERCSPQFRHELLRLLTGWWDFEEASSMKQLQLVQLFQFFNGDIYDEGPLVHYCSGPDCCRNESHSLSRVPCF